ncbi:MADS-box transcription factor 26-like [Curcuma longa]|uniref:MADS-box transcription factor 26-like n=1 Tax=Curcuma longa TaxID=136217 RepID=UPI003D9E019A
MVRGKVQLKLIENPVHRKVTFSKRRAGLLKKARELSVMCDADVGIMVFSAHGKLYELATNGTMEGLIERYKMTSQEAQNYMSVAMDQPQDSEREISRLKEEINVLQKSLRHMFGEGSSGHEQMSLDELYILERHVGIWMDHIRTMKMQIILQEIESLKSKEGMLKATNEFLQEKIVEKQGAYDAASVMVQPEGHFEMSPTAVAENINAYPLTEQDQLYNFWGPETGFSF